MTAKIESENQGLIKVGPPLNKLQIKKIRLETSQTLKENPISSIRELLEHYSLNTVCQEAACPNLNHCWQQGAATFMLMGKNCTRRCGFCNITTARPSPLDPNEPENIAKALSTLNLKHVVLTSVDRDDLADCGSEHFAKTIKIVKNENPLLRIEVLIPDFKGRIENLEKIWESKPDIINHNVETVPSLYKKICPQSNYEVSLKVLKLSSLHVKYTKSGIILGMGETLDEVKKTILDLIENKVQLLTLGQYLQPSPKHAPLKEMIPLEAFSELKQYALERGMGYVESGPLVRSSFHAGESFENYLSSHFENP